MLLRLGIVLGLLAIAACDGGVEFCTDRDDAGNCIFDEQPMFDGGGGLDGGGPASDGAPSDEAAVVDASGMDGATGGLDAEQALTPTAFCELQLWTAVSWRAFFEGVCDCATQPERDERDYFLGAALFYSDMSGVQCLSAVEDLQRRTTISFDAEQAAGCAARFASQFAAPPGACAGGVQIENLEAMVGHGAQQLAQFPECRATFAGNVARDGMCTDSFDCSGGLRCQPLPGSSGGADGGRPPMSCQPARTNLETCTNRSDCADGLICVRSDSSTTGTVCIPTNELRNEGGQCRASRECAAGLICDCPTADCATGTCAPPSASAAVCAPP